MDIARRDLFKAGAVIGGIAALGGLAGCAPAKTSLGESGEATNATARTLPAYLTEEDFANSIVEIDEITDFTDEKTFDVVVIGAGISGVPAVMTALEEGATVCCLQKQDVVAANGSGSSGIVLEACTGIGAENWKRMLRETTSFRADNALLDFYASHSGEAVRWLGKTAFKAGFDGGSATTPFSFPDGTAALKVSNVFRTNNDAMTAIAEVAQAQGAEFFFSTPAVQLVKDDSGRVTGAIGKTADGSYIKFNATKAVIIAAGDYENNESMVARFAADTVPFRHVQSQRTGDGILMAALAGGHMVLGAHPCQLHDMHTSPMPVQGTPFLAVSMNGKRFMDESIGMTNWWQVLRRQTNVDYVGNFCRIFDSTFPEFLAKAAPKMPAPTAEEFEPYMPNGSNYNGNGGMFCADTLEDLADQMGIPKDELIKSVERYNELCEKGFDEDFGKDAQYLAPIAEAPFWGILQEVTCCAIDAGIAVDGNYQVIDDDANPIPGLFSVGSGAGNLCGYINWPLEYTGSIAPMYKAGIFGGLSNGHCVTAGRYATIYALTGDYKPASPTEWNEDVAAFYEGKGAPAPW